MLATSVRALPVADYVNRLAVIDGLLEQNALELAKIEAKALLGTRVEWSRGYFFADDSLLQSIVDSGSASGPHRARIAATIVELRRATGMDTAQGDRKLLARIAAEQDVPDLPQGGNIPTRIERDIPLMERVGEAVNDMLEWIREKLKKLLDWLLDLVPSRRPQESTASVATRWIVFVVVALIVIIVLVLAVSVLRRSRASSDETVQSSAPPLGSKADEDPLSRGASEWERYAADLARAGRYREAIRAWYHAVLVTCYAAGILHFRKGRTNWEYVASLGPSVEWRPELIELTHRFEREWYGSLQSTEEVADECGQRATGIIETVRGAE
jgi:hypothetical protein